MELGSSKWKRLIIDSAREINIPVSNFQADQFAIHAVELEKWSKKINITAISDPAEVAIKHFVDSITPVRLISPNQRLLDIGSGGGFPGIPLKIMIPSLSVRLIDASRKKTNFLKHVLRLLKTDDIEARQIRLEDFVVETMNFQTFDIVVCRALTNLRSFVEKAIPLLSENGTIIAFKGIISENELKSVQTITVQNSDTSEITKHHFTANLIKLMLPRINAERSIITLKTNHVNEL